MTMAVQVADPRFERLGAEPRFHYGVIGVASAALTVGVVAVARRVYRSMDAYCQRGQYRAQAAYAVVKARARGMLKRVGLGSPGIRPTDTMIDTAWLTEILRSKRVLSKEESVVSAELSFLSNNRGLSAAMFSVAVQYASTAADIVEAPDTFVLKMSRCGSAEVHYRNIARRSYKESAFYETLAHKLEYLPKVYYSYHNSFTGEFVILMEDVRPKYEGVNYYFGNQVWGSREVRYALEPLDMLRLVFIRAADLHAKYWNDKSLLSLPWLKGVQWYQGKDRAAWEIGIEAASAAWRQVKAAIAAGKANVKWSSAVMKAVDACQRNTSWKALQQHLHDAAVPFTLTHGDFHASNMFVKAPTCGSRSLLLVDWSEVGLWEPTADLGQIIISDVRPDVWRGKDKALVQLYWERLVTQGVSAKEYSFEMCWQQYQRSALERWLWLLPVLASMGLPDFAVQYFHDQVEAFLTTHSGEFMKSLSWKPIVCFG